MMLDAPTSDNVQARTIYMYENERYSPISGWSFKGLLPTDRKAFTTFDGLEGFNQLAEASAAYICPGWDWLPKQDWAIDMNLDIIDKDGWTYSVDFGSLKDETCGNKVKGAMHFVRRRRWVRFQYFDVKLIAREAVLTCSYCDLEEVERLGALLLERLAQASAYKHPAKNSDVKTIALKGRMMAILDITNAATESYSYGMIESRLNTFVQQSKSTLSAASSMMATDSAEETLRKRTAWISRTFFPPEEVHEVARLILRLLDRSNAYHCEKPHCGTECDFYLEVCGNDGCGMTYSRKWAEKHADMCPHKILPCERECGENVKRMMMREHMAEYCGLRIVRCPCYDLGCKAEILARELEQHGVEAQLLHLGMIVKRIKEVQTVVAGHQQSIASLDATTRAHETALATATAGIAGALAASTVVQVKADKNLNDAVRSLESKMARDASAVSAVRADVNAIRAQLAPKK